jgi:hypothetical protein
MLIFNSFGPKGRDVQPTMQLKFYENARCRWPGETIVLFKKRCCFVSVSTG